MAGVDNGLTGQGEQFFAYRVYQCAVVAVGEVGAAYAATEQCITAEEHILLWQVVGQAAGGVTGNGYGHNAAVAEGDFIAIVEDAPEWRYIFVIPHSKACYTLLDILGPRPVGIVGAGLYSKCLLNECIAEYVVEMQMGVEVMLECETVALNELFDLFSLLREPRTAVNEHSLFCVVPKEIAVYLYGVYYEFL